MVLKDSRSGFYDVTDDAIIVATLRLNISEARPDSGMVPMDNLYKLAYRLSIAHAPDVIRRSVCPKYILLLTLISYIPLRYFATLGT